MMTPEQCAKSWQIIKNNYKNHTNPEICMMDIIDILGVNNTYEIFAVISAIKKHDGRIYGKNREVMNTIPFDPRCAEWEYGNPLIKTGLDDIHTAHINQLITELRKYKREEV